MKLWEYIKGKMQGHPKQTINENDICISYKEMISMSEDFAKKMTGLQCCAIYCDSEMMAAKALLSCFAAEITAVPLSKRYGEIHCNKIIDKIQPDALITDIDGKLNLLKFSSAEYIAPPMHPALIMCTSGTTGTPKGAMLSENNILTNVADIIDYFEIDETDTIFISRPLYHCAVLTGEFITALCKGVSIRFYSYTFNPALMPSMISKYDITVLCGTPTLMSLMMRFIRHNMDVPLKHICISGECMSRETGLRIAETFPKAKIYHVYGLTEACPRVCYLPPDMFREYPDYVGIPLRSVKAKIIKGDSVPAKENEEGILYINGKNIMSGYYKDDRKTNDVLKDGWLCTGDIAVQNSMGFIKIKGRRDDMIIKAGMNIYPQEIESSLKKDMRVKEVLAYGYKTFTGTQIGLKISGNFASTDEVRDLCSETLPQYQIPMKIELLPELEKNGSGKIKRR